MFYNVEKVHDLIDLEGQKFQKKLLIGDSITNVTLVALKKDEIIDTHISQRDTLLCVVEGEIEMHFEAEKFKISVGECLAFHKEKEHKVLALENSKFILIKV